MSADYQQYEIKDGIVFLIELTSSIFQPVEELSYRSQLQEILHYINVLMSELIITSHNTGVGLYLYNLMDTSKRFKDGCGIKEIFLLDDINSQNMKRLNDILDNDTKGIRTLSQEFPQDPKGVESLAIVLNTILSEFNSKAHYNTKKLVWFTANDNPFDDEGTKRRLWKIINDYQEYHINVSPMFLVAPGLSRKFDMAKYQDIFLNSGGLKDPDDEDASVNDYIALQVQKSKVRLPTLATKIRSNIMRLKEIKRIQFSCDLVLSDGSQLGGNLGCSVKGYSMYNHEKPTRHEHLYMKDETPKPVRVKTRYINETTGEELLTGEDETSSSKTVKGFPIGESHVLYLDDKQVHYLKNYTFDHTPDGDLVKHEEEEELNVFPDEDASKLVTISRPAYLKLLGFRKTNLFKPFFNTANPLFVTPDLNNGLRNSSSTGGYQNSFTTFSSLYQSCVKLKRYAVVFGCLKRNAIPCVYNLYPTGIENSTKLNQLFPQGFLLIRLPWIEDIRSLPEYVLRDNSHHLSDAARLSNPAFQDLVSQYKLIFNEFGLSSYEPSEFPNPSLNYFYKILRMHLLQIDGVNTADRAEVEESLANDTTMNKLTDMHNYIFEKTEKFGNEPRGILFKKLNNSLNALSNIDVIENQAVDNKRQKTEVALSDQDILTAWKTDSWSYFNVSQLRSFITSHREIKKATRKADMIENIIEFLQGKFAK